VVRAAAWAGSGLTCALLNIGKSKVVSDAARIPTLTFAVGAQSVVDTFCCVSVCVGAKGCFLTSDEGAAFQERLRGGNGSDRFSRDIIASHYYVKQKGLITLTPEMFVVGPLSHIEDNHLPPRPSAEDAKAMQRIGHFTALHAAPSIFFAKRFALPSELFLCEDSEANQSLRKLCAEEKFQVMPEKNLI